MALTSWSGGGETAFSECATKGSWLLTLSRRCVRRSCDSGLSERVRVFDGPLDLKKHDSGHGCRGCFRCRRGQLDTDVANDSHCAKPPGLQRCANTHMKLSSHQHMCLHVVIQEGCNATSKNPATNGDGWQHSHRTTAERRVMRSKTRVCGNERCTMECEVNT
ncbi:hypothetical protein ERJ75_001572600 [Trypanosoma vivax]|nr:hypothetical protein ERJ75_001572600 [Trypanosoma vivax]